MNEFKLGCETIGNNEQFYNLVGIIVDFHVLSLTVLLSLYSFYHPHEIK